MAATFYSGFKNKKSALDFLLDNIYSGFQMKRSICIVLKDEEHSRNLKNAQKQKYFENSKIEYLYDENICLLEEQPKESFDEIHIFSDKVSNLDEYAESEVYIYTTEADSEINDASRKLYANLKTNNFELNHERI
tara:strand:- start:399 stop:803 length:405 start_codon:yes stop_codon:yes gene_type:complete